LVNQFGLSIRADDRPGLLRDIASVVAEADANIEAIHHEPGQPTLMHFDIKGLVDASRLREEVLAVASVSDVQITESAGTIFGKRVIVIGGGAQVAQVVLGAVSEADRHNIRGERISVDTIPLVGEEKLADAVRAVARLPRARILVLAGSIMGGDIANAVRELSMVHGSPVISLAMVGSVPEAADLVVSDPVQAGTMAVMAIAATAKFDLNRVRGQRF
jgi:energy-converting hydrogenase B subunit Q